MASKSKPPVKAIQARDYRAIARDLDGKSIRFDVRNVSSTDEAVSELKFQVRNLRTVLLLVKA